MSYALTATVDQSPGDTVEQVRDALRAQGFGILTEIDIQATLGVEVPSRSSSAPAIHRWPTPRCKPWQRTPPAG